jgi:hypothetical protein
VFDLHSPCAACPFRIGQGSLFLLRPERLAEIKGATAFQCHKTLSRRATSLTTKHAAKRKRLPGDPPPQQCAGLMAVLTRDKRPNQIMQVAQRLGALDPAMLDPRREAYATWRDVLAAHAGAEPQG